MSIAQQGVYWPFKTLLQGSGITIVEDPVSIRIGTTGAGPGGGDMLSSVYATNGTPGIVDKAQLAEGLAAGVTVPLAQQANTVPWNGVTGTPTSFPSDWSVITSKPATFPPSIHGPSHLPGGGDPLSLASATGPGWLAQLSGASTDYVGGDNACHALSSVPSGTIEIFCSRFVVPVGWLFCDGTAVSRTLYPSLFSVLSAAITANTVAGNTTITYTSTLPPIEAGYPISGPVIQQGTTIVSVNTTTNTMVISKAATLTQNGVALVVAPWGVGDGQLTFNLPDLRGRAPIGWGGAQAGLSARALASLGGEEKHALVTAEMAVHSHAASASVSDPKHTHGIYYTHAGGTGQDGLGDASPGGSLGVDYSSAVPNATGIGVTVAIGNAGGGGGHNNMQPFGVVYFIVKT